MKGEVPRVVRLTWLRYSIESSYRRTRQDLMEATKDIRASKRRLNEEIRELEKKVWEGDINSPEELASLRSRREKLLKGIEALQAQYDKVAKPYRARLRRARELVKSLDTTIIPEALKEFGLGVKPIDLEEAERLLLLLKSEDLKSEEEVESDNGGGTGKA